MTIRFQADADLNQAIVSGVLRRNSSIDFQAANVSDLSGLTDLEVLLVASREERVLVSHDQRTMPKYFAEFISTQTSSGLIIVLQSMPISEAIDNLLRIWEASESKDWVNRIAYLPL
jgi:predicted nuclease of predicted toxin-antitoxin system